MNQVVTFCCTLHLVKRKFETVICNIMSCTVLDKFGLFITYCSSIKKSLVLCDNRLMIVLPILSGHSNLVCIDVRTDVVIPSKRNTEPSEQEPYFQSNVSIRMYRAECFPEYPSFVLNKCLGFSFFGLWVAPCLVDIFHSLPRNLVARTKGYCRVPRNVRQKCVRLTTSCWPDCVTVMHTAHVGLKKVAPEKQIKSTIAFFPSKICNADTDSMSFFLFRSNHPSHRRLVSTLNISMPVFGDRRHHIAPSSFRIHDRALSQKAYPISILVTERYFFWEIPSHRSLSRQSYPQIHRESIIMLPLLYLGAIVVAVPVSMVGHACLQIWWHGHLPGIGT